MMKEETGVNVTVDANMDSSCNGGSALSIGSGQEGESERFYIMNVDRAQNDKATHIRLCSFARPHMRAFHCAWWAYFLAFNLWFAAAPLLSEIRDSLDLSNAEIWTSSIAGVGGTIFMRLLFGPLCDKYGARVLNTCVLCLTAIPTACLGFVQTATGLTVLRLFIGFVGGCFAMCVFWCTTMFTKEVVGTANATAAGWGNLGAGFAQLFVGSMLFPLFKWFFSHGTDDEAEIAEKAWRTVSIVPATIAFASGIIMYYIADDSPRGNFHELKKSGAMQEVNASKSFIGGVKNINTWLLFVQYACCFGVEMTMNNAAALYFKDEFGLSTESAAAIAAIFGWMNLFARGLGGWVCDKGNAWSGMRGRLWVHSIVLLFEGIMVLIFAQTRGLGIAIAVMVFFSLFVQMAEGSSFGIVPYVNPPIVGSISGIVGSGGNVGAVLFSLFFRQLPYYEAFMYMGAIIILSSFLSLFIFIPGQSSLLWGAVSSSDDDLDKPKSDSAMTSRDSYSDDVDAEKGEPSITMVKEQVGYDLDVLTSAKCNLDMTADELCIEESLAHAKECY